MLCVRIHWWDGLKISSVLSSVCVCLMSDWGLFYLFIESVSCSVMSDSLLPHGLHSPWNSPGQNPAVGSSSLLQGIFPTQGWNPGLPHCRQFLYQLSHERSLRILEWVAYPFSSGSSQPKNWTWVSCIADRFFTNWAIREFIRHFKIKSCQKINYTYVCVCAKLLSHVWLFVTPWTIAHWLCPWNFPGKNTRLGCHFLFQGIFLTQGSNLGLLRLLHWQVDFSPLCNLGSPVCVCVCVYLYINKIIYKYI